MRAGDAKGLTAWGSGPRFVLLCLAAAAILVVAFEQVGPSAAQQRAALEHVAERVNEPLRELGPFHARIASRGGGDTVFVGPLREACIEAAAPAERLAGLTLPPGGQAKAIELAEDVRRAAGHFLEEARACAKPGPEALPTCVVRCMRSWSSLVGSAERLRAEAARLGVRMEPLGPAAAQRSTP